MIYPFIFYLVTNKTGGLFDLDGTFFLILLQFLILMFTLNFILYNPISNSIIERTNYITNNLKISSNILLKTDQLTKFYHNQIAHIQKIVELEKKDLQKQYRKVALKKKEILQNTLDKHINNIINSFNLDKDIIYVTMHQKILLLSDEIISKIFTNKNTLK